MGMPAKLGSAQLAQLTALTRDVPESERVISIGKPGSFAVNLPMRSNDVVLVTLEPVAQR
jgi:xylan 1,4-beta-xylosidase